MNNSKRAVRYALLTSAAAVAPAFAADETIREVVVTGSRIAQPNLGGPGAVKLRDTIAARHAMNPSQFNLPDDARELLGSVRQLDDHGRAQSVRVPPPEPLVYVAPAK